MNGSTQRLNLGCGARYCTDEGWLNVDFHPNPPHVIGCDLRTGLPFPAESFDVVYHSHVLEHFGQVDGAKLLAECHRVLKSGGFIRFAVPDLEGICRGYLESLDHLKDGDDAWRGRYDWMLLELYDQCVRNESSGRMPEYFRRAAAADRAFAIGRAGNVGRDLERAATTANGLGSVSTLGCRTFVRRVFSAIRRAPVRLRKWMATRFLSPRERDALAIGMFRTGGEVHQWMYDTYSARVLLEDCGFTDVRSMPATESRIPNWPQWHLDIDSDGTEHAPASLYMEARKSR